MSQYTPVTIYPNDDGYTVVAKYPDFENGQIHETADTFDSFESMSDYLKKQFGE